MMKFEIYKVDSGLLLPTGFFAIAKKLEHVELDLYRKINELNMPCLIVTKPYKRYAHEKERSSTN